MPPRRDGVRALIGHTPLVEIARLNPYRKKVRIFAKLESRNPGGSVKDRPALSIIEDGEARRRLTAETTLIDATSGNTGIAYAMLCAASGYRATLVMPANASEERKKVLRAFGAELVLTDPAEGQDGAIDRVREMVKAGRERWFYADQYSNPANPRAHAETTGPEIWRGTRGRLTHFVAGLGTSGTMMGVGRFLRERAPEVRLVGVEPSGPFHGLEGLKHMATSHVPAIFDANKVDARATVATERAFELTRRLAREEGLFCGQSSGAALAACLDLAKDLPSGRIVTIFPDGGEKYLSTRLWESAG
ncbi:MAG: PLP-dependent cysteine synthase family protein [Thermoplasmatota archaeon]